MIDLSSSKLPSRWTSARLARIGWILPIVAVAQLILVLALLSGGRRQAGTTLEGILFVVSLGLVPVGGIAGIVLAIMAIGRGRREAGTGGRPARVAPIVAIVLGVGLTAITLAVVGLAFVAVSGIG